MTTKTFEEQLITARERAVPIIMVRTADQFSTLATIRKACPGFAIVTWDAARGIAPVLGPDGKPEKTSTDAIALLKTGDTLQFVDALTAVQKMPKAGVTVVFNAYRQLVSSEPYAVAQNVQAIANLRDLYKKDHRSLILLGPEFTVPQELEHDVVVFDHALPGPDILAAVVTELHASAELPAPTPEIVSKSVDALRGLSEFAAEQVVAMSLIPKTATHPGGIDVHALWERKRVMIEQTRGLRVWRGNERFSDIVGCESIKACLREQMNGKRPIGVVVFMDEIDKIFANVEHDTSNVKMDQLRSLLTKMEDNEWTGITCVGVPGAGKSLIAKAFGNEAGVPTIALDLGDMEAPHVGESEALMRHGISVIESMGSGNAFFISTSNNASVMRPELQRRFTEGTFFFDLMSKEERAVAWAFYMTKYELPKQPLPNDDGWTGAEVRNCCRRAWNTNKTLIEASRFIVPMARSRVKDIDALRQQAHETMLDANKPGMYTYTTEQTAVIRRAIAMPKEMISAIEQMKES